MEAPQAGPTRVLYLGGLGRSGTTLLERLRFQTGPLQLCRDETWRTRLAPQGRRAVTALTLPLLRHYGYLKGRPA